MGYAQYLRDLLSPLQVYDLTPSAFSGAEIVSLGASLDALWETAQQAQQESAVASAQGMGLQNWESLFPHLAATTDLDSRRRAIGGFLSIGDDSFTLSALSRCLEACGVTCQLSETDQHGVVAVSFPQSMGEPENFEQIAQIIEDILPCHLEIQYQLHWCIWGDLSALTWGDIAALSWGELQCYVVK